MSHSMSDSQRLEELESRLAFQDDAIQALTQTVAEQDGAILLLQQQLKTLVTRYQEMAFSMDQQAASTNERPPHYL